jgi:hypothetical protein
MSRVTFIAGENINKGDAIALGSGYSIARKASATSSLYNSVIGFATHGAAAGSAVLVNRDTIFTSLSGLSRRLRREIFCRSWMLARFLQAIKISL